MTKDMGKVKGLDVFSALALLAGSVLEFPVWSSGVWGHRAPHTLQKTKLETTEANWAFSSPWDHVGANVTAKLLFSCARRGS